MTPQRKSERIKELGLELGFDAVGVAAAGPIGHGDYYRRWLAEGRAGTMDYLHRHVEKRLDSSELLPGARSVIMASHNYKQSEPEAGDGGEPRGRVAMYAWGRDYHRVVKKKLHRLADRMRDELDEPFEAKACVDTAPLAEREVAAAAGLGWIAKNTMLLNQRLGSLCFLGAIVTTLELAADEPVPDGCARCTRCLDACPTGALVGPYEMDARRCISYLTIEHRADVPEDLAVQMQDWVFGCDVCQSVCPYNRKAPATREPDYDVRPPGPRPSLQTLLEWTEGDYREQLAGSALKRARLWMLHRNAAIARENLEKG